MKRYKYLLTLILIVLSWQGNAQRGDSVLHITTENISRIDPDTGSWRFKAGDNLQWAAKNIDGAGWVKASPVMHSVKDFKKIGFKGMGWFRLYIDIDSSLVAKPLVLDLISNGAAEIYIDGKVISKIGTLKNGDGSTYQKPFFPSVFVLNDTGVHVIAVRYENIYYESLVKGWSGNNAGFNVSLFQYQAYFEARKENILFQSLFLLISAGIFLALFLSHLVMYFFHKQYPANLIFSLFNLGLGVFFLVSYVAGFIEVADTKKGLLPIFVLAPAVSFLVLNVLVNRLFIRSRVRIIISVFFLTAVVICTFTAYRISILLLFVYLAYTLLEAAIVVIIALKRSVPGAKTLSVGILATFLLFAIIAIGSTAGKLSFEGYLGLVFIILSMLTIFSLPLSMSAYLAWSFARVNKDLAVQLEKVEALSQKTLEQEQEKQRILESQKDDLEQQVAARTMELTQQKEALATEKKKSDDLLLNILPAEVAEELKETGTTKAQHFDHVTVLFTDFVNFTQISEQLSPEELVQELHECFRAFDDIMERNGLEKIKTIGDAYLAVSGMPVANERHAYNAVKAGLEIVDFILNRSSDKRSFEVRVGINSGELVAGIVGVKKFAYDIWGDTVNMASRMESNSEPGKVNVSENTHELILNDFTFTYRGKINAKNKGEVDMYFVDEMIIHSI
jgi:class 3 adenylate cyclase